MRVLFILLLSVLSLSAADNQDPIKQRLQAIENQYAEANRLKIEQAAEALAAHKELMKTLQEGLYALVMAGLAASGKMVYTVWADKRRHLIELEARDAVATRAAEAKEAVLAALEENTVISKNAFTVGNNLNEKLLEMDRKIAFAIPDSEKILNRMLALDGSIAPADIAQVLIDMRRSADVLELYAHRNVHAIGNVLQKLYAHLLKQDPHSKILHDLEAYMQQRKTGIS